MPEVGRLLNLPVCAASLDEVAVARRNGLAEPRARQDPTRFFSVHQRETTMIHVRMLAVSADRNSSWAAKYFAVFLTNRLLCATCKAMHADGQHQQRWQQLYKYLWKIVSHQTLYTFRQDCVKLRIDSTTNWPTVVRQSSGDHDQRDIIWAPGQQNDDADRIQLHSMLAEAASARRKCR